MSGTILTSTSVLVEVLHLYCLMKSRKMVDTIDIGHGSIAEAPLVDYSYYKKETDALATEHDY